mmetsp:Transcript_33582/g.38603  ORF Transcript_33582/g.38603 Transcript_33582/m.38603 type:complete len:264 (-) Transcript_33582:52-843(-)
MLLVRMVRFRVILVVFQKDLVMSQALIEVAHVLLERHLLVVDRVFQLHFLCLEGQKDFEQLVRRGHLLHTVFVSLRLELFEALCSIHQAEQISLNVWIFNFVFSDFFWNGNRNWNFWFTWEVNRLSIKNLFLRFCFLFSFFAYFLRCLLVRNRFGFYLRGLFDHLFFSFILLILNWFLNFLFDFFFNLLLFGKLLGVDFKWIGDAQNLHDLDVLSELFILVLSKPELKDVLLSVPRERLLEWLTWLESHKRDDLISIKKVKHV